MTRSIFCTIPAAVACLLCAAPAAHAQQRSPADSYPNKPVRVIQAAAPGGSLDVVSRLVMGPVAERSGRAFVLDPRGGASGAIGVDIVAKAPADGYTLLAAAMSHIVTVPLLNKVPYDTQRDLAPIAEFAAQPYILAVNAALPVTTVKDLIALAKSKPGTLNYGSGGSGTSNHLTMELFKQIAGIDAMHVPYKGGTGPTMVALIGGEINLFFGGVTATAPQAKTGKIKLLGITSLKRLSLLPDLPTIAESGLPGFEAVGWYGLLAPKGTPPAVINTLNREVNDALNTAALRKTFAEDGTEVTPGTPAEFQNVIDREIAKWTKLFKQSNLKL